MMYSTTFQQTDVSDTGRKLDALALSPFLNIGVTNASFQSSVMVPWSIDVWNSIVKVGVINAAVVPKNMVDIMSGPLVL